MTELQEKLYRTGVIPVVKISEAEKAVPLAKALTEGGIGVAEITFRTDSAARSIAAIRESCPELLVGAGTVLSVKCLDEAIAAGAQFIVAPGLNPKVAEAALARGIPYVPGVMTPTEIEAALSYGLDFVKFFPAEAAGGVKMLKALHAPYSMMTFMPTGGVTIQNAADYLNLKFVLCCGGSFIAESAAIDAGDFDAIRRNASAVSGFVSALRK